MKFKKLLLNGAFIIEPEIIKDQRGSFYRVICSNELKTIGHNESIVQVNHSINMEPGTIRGLHFRFRRNLKLK